MAETNKKKADKKVVILGSQQIGKTCLIRRYIEGIFSDEMPSTIGCSFFLKQWGSKNIAIWDTAGQEVWSGLTNFYCRGAHCVILCYDLTDRSSFDDIDTRHQRLLDTVAEKCVIVLVGTKVDLLTSHKKVVSDDEVMSVALYFRDKFNSVTHPSGKLPIFETSSKDNIQVKDVFEFIFDTLAPEESKDSFKPPYRPQGIVTLGENVESTKKKCC